MSDDHVIFEYRAKITNAGHAEDVGEPVHCFIKMKSGDAKGKRRRNVELEQLAGDNILFVLNPGPYRKITTQAFGSSAKKPLKKQGPRLSGTEWETVRSCVIRTEYSCPAWTAVSKRATARTNANPRRKSPQKMCPRFIQWVLYKVTKRPISNEGGRVSLPTYCRIPSAYLRLR